MSIDFHKQEGTFPMNYARLSIKKWNDDYIFVRVSIVKQKQALDFVLINTLLLTRLILT